MLITKYPDIFNIDRENYIITSEDLEGLKAGDKVSLKLYNPLNNDIIEEKGTIKEINNNVLTIRKYKARNKGWFITANYKGQISLGW